MSEGFISRGFLGRRRQPDASSRIPPGQYEETGFPVLTAGPTPHSDLKEWSFAINGLVRAPIRWSWEEFQKLPRRSFTVDIHCVTKWSKLGTEWEGVSIDTLLQQVDLDPRARFVTAFCDGDYTTNLPLEDLTGGKAFIGYGFAGYPLPSEHGGPARLVVPHLYFWKSAKWVRGLTFMESDQPGFWESLGYHNRGDPWKEQRYQGD
jgi:DMSO/TMAO reductase YedYZ molybdopterin-dependent catalytic subunit